MPSLEGYRSHLDYSYAPGIFPAMECLLHRPEKVRRILVHSAAAGREGVGKLTELAGVIEKSGLGIREEYEEFDAEKKFDIKIEPSKEKSPCRCGDVICGKLSPRDCPMFGKACLPENPVGPCMVSSEGACAAAYKYSE